MGKHGHLTREEIIEIIQGREDISSFVETGTYKGDSTLSAVGIFDDIYTIEIVESLYKESLERFNGKGINSILGDTVQVLPGLCKNISGATFWFLDAHQSGPDTSNNGQHVPLLNEIECIGSNKDISNDIFVIDDVRLFSAFWDWSHISIKGIKEKIESFGFVIGDVSIANDRLIVKPLRP